MKLLLYKQARSQGEHSGAVLPNFIVHRKICSKHLVKTKILPRKMYFFPKLNTWSHLVLLDILFVLIMWNLYMFTNSPWCVF